MKFLTYSGDFCKVAQKVLAVAKNYKKSNLLDKVYIDAQGNEFSISFLNIDHEAIYVKTYCDIVVPGGACVYTENLAKIVSDLTSVETNITVIAESGKVTVKRAGKVLSIPAIDMDIGKFDGYKHRDIRKDGTLSMVIECQEFLRIVNTLAPFAAEDINRPMYRGIHINPARSRAEAVNGFCGMVTPIHGEFKSQDAYVISREVCKNAKSVFCLREEKEAPVSVYLSSDKMVLAFFTEALDIQTTYFVRNTDITNGYLDVNKATSIVPDFYLVVDSNDFKAIASDYKKMNTGGAMKSMPMVIAHNRAGDICAAFVNNSYATADAIKGSVITSRSEDDWYVCGYNPAFLLNYCNSFESDKYSITFHSNTSMAIIKAADDVDGKHGFGFFLPIRINPAEIDKYLYVLTELKAA